ncbi:hypothetical protein D9M68_873770 [compost metagenome]
MGRSWCSLAIPFMVCLTVELEVGSKNPCCLCHLDRADNRCRRVLTFKLCA